MKHLIFIVILPLLCSGIFAQNEPFVRAICPESIRENIDSLRAEFGKNKTYPAAEELQILAALSFYPELKETRIVFRNGIINSSLQARPDWYSLFKSRKNRKYLILTNDDDCSPIHPCNSDFDSQVGFYAHEVAHILDYESKSKKELLEYGWKYYFDDDFKKHLEQKTDLIAIDHGAGFLKYHASCFIFYKSEATEEYLEEKKKFYFTPEQILKRTNWAERIFMEN